MSYRYLLLTLVLLFPMHPAFAGDTKVGGCDLKRVFNVTDNKEFLDFDAAFHKALKAGDPTSISLLVKFPLHVTHGDDRGISMDDARTLEAAFDEAFPKVVRDAVLNEQPKDYFCTEDRFIYDDGKGEVDVKQVDVGGAKEFRVTGVAVMQDDATTSSKGFKAALICHTPKYRIIVDTDESDRSRYRAWIKPHEGFDKPDMEIVGGTYEGGGSGMCGYSAWAFKNGKTLYTVSELGCTDGSEPKGSIGSVRISATDNPDHPIETLWCYQ